MVRPSLLTKSFNIASDELERARYCAKEQGISLNKFLRFAVIERTQGVLQGLEATDTLNEIRATARESEIRSALALESLLADLRAEQSVAIHENRELVMGSTPFSRTLTRRPIQAMRSVHVKAS